MAFNSLLKQTRYYEKLSNLRLIDSHTLQKAIQLSSFKWFVKNTFFKYFNPKLKLKGKAEIAELKELRKEMTFAELNHSRVLLCFNFRFCQTCRWLIFVWLHHDAREYIIKFIPIITTATK